MNEPAATAKLALHRLALRVFGALPRRARRVLVRAGSPKYTVGAICIVTRDDGAILLVRHSYYRLWGTPGGLSKRNERPEDAVVRETLEEVNLRVELVGEPVVVVEPMPRRVDVVYAARPAPGEDTDAAGRDDHRAASTGAQRADRLGGCEPGRRRIPLRVGAGAAIGSPVQGA